ncbi:MAG: hypothetical protein HYZ34_09105 [Ignavibacteriae bacterium]|nr:hypothetical protein [Ignavibacteriota bacterium]
MFCLICCSTTSSSQSVNLRFAHLTTSDGLSEGVVYRILQDSKGYLWFATHEGLNRYDGYSFKTFKHDPYDSLSLCNNQVTALFEDSRGILWVGTQKGAQRFDRNTETFHKMTRGTNDSTLFLLGGIGAFAEDRFGNLWIGAVER